MDAVTPGSSSALILPADVKEGLILLEVWMWFCTKNFVIDFLFGLDVEVKFLVAV